MIQKIYKSLGDGGCYFLSLLKAAEGITGKKIDPVVAYSECVAAGFMKKDCFMDYAHRILEKYTGIIYDVLKMPANYPCEKGEIEILYFERPTPSEIFGHFVLGDGKGKVAYDPLGTSETVKNGTLKSKRIFRRVI